MKYSRLILGLVLIFGLVGTIVLSIGSLKVDGVSIDIPALSLRPAESGNNSSLISSHQQLPSAATTTQPPAATTDSTTQPPAATTTLKSTATEPPPSTTSSIHWRNARFEHLEKESSGTVQQEKMCDEKYPPATINMLKRTLALRGVHSIAIVAILKSCVKELSSIERAIFQVAEVVSPENVFVSILESGSDDETPGYLRNMSDRLQVFGVSNVISTGKRPISAFWDGRVGSRIDFLSKLRNAAMIPALDGHPVGHFDKFFFINDVYNCGGDILRLLAHDADIACGMDFGADNDDFYDKWVHSDWLLDKFNYQEWNKDRGYRNRVNTPAFNVFSCWNGGIASRAALWYNGVRFRQGMKELGDGDCSQSEATLWAMDAHTLGYNKVVLDPTVQSGYKWRPYVRNFRDASPEIKKSVYSPQLNATKVDVHNILYRCCEIEGSNMHVDLSKCVTRKLETPGRAECLANTTKCLRYTPSRWVENWDWKSLLKKAGTPNV